MKKLLKQLRNFTEYLILVIFVSVFGRLSIDRSANICSIIARKIGPYLKFTKIARNNMHYILGKNVDIEQVLDDLWDNFGRFIGEFPHIASISDDEATKRVKIEGADILKEKISQNQPFLLFTGHLANWDFVLRSVAKTRPKFATIYRKANNPLVDKFICDARRSSGVELIAKGPSGIKDLLRAIRANTPIIMLVDQKMNDGISVPFFGKPAMTAPAIAKIALQYGYPIIPCQIIREKGSYFRVIFHEPLNYEVSDSQTKTIQGIMVQINNILEDWIRERPAQWFWFHNRWGKNKAEAA